MQRNPILVVATAAALTPGLLFGQQFATCDPADPQASLFLDGVDDAVGIPYSPFYPIGELTAAAWIRIPPGEQGALIARGEDPVTDVTPWRVRVGGGRLVFSGEASADFHYVSDVFVDDGEWHHVAVTSQVGGGTRFVKFYLDGSLGNTITDTVVGTLPDGQQELTIGCHHGENPTLLTDFIQGDIGEVAVWNRGLSAGEVAAMHAAGVDVASPGLVLYLPLDEGAGSMVTSSSPIPAPDGSFKGGPLWRLEPFCPLSALGSEISLFQGGSQELGIDADPAHNLDFYLVLGSASGTSPGVPVDGLTVPLVPDAYLLFTAANPNTPPLFNTVGFLDSSGDAVASIGVPPMSNPSLAGATLHHAFVVLDTAPPTGLAPVVVASNAVPLGLVP